MIDFECSLFYQYLHILETAIEDSFSAINDENPDQYLSVLKLRRKYYSTMDDVFSNY